LENFIVAPLLTYFDVRGRAEVARLILEETGTPYREKRVQVTDWLALKPTLPFGQLPLFEDDDVTIVHSHAIYRYLARKHHLYGASELDHVRCDIVEESFTDAQASLLALFWNPEFAKLRDTYENTTLPDMLGKLQQLLETNNNGAGYWVSNVVTLADFVAWYTLDCVRAFSSSTLERFVTLNAFRQRFQQRPRIAAYLQSERRPKTITISRASFGGTVETS